MRCSITGTILIFVPKFGDKVITKFDIADYIIAKYEGEITPLKLQKLLYYSYVWSLVTGKKVFDATFEAWNYGPVEPFIYHHYKPYGKAVIPSQKKISVAMPPEIDFILDSYAHFSAIELSKTTHLEKPWKQNAVNKALIPDEDLISFYKKHPYAKNFPLQQGKPYYPPKTSSHYSFTFDMSKDYVPVYESIDDYLTSIKKARKEFTSLSFGE